MIPLARSNPCDCNRARVGRGVGGRRGECVVCPRQGITVAFTTGVMMALLFLAFRHVYLGMPLGGDTLHTLWPMWFPWPTILALLVT